MPSIAGTQYRHSALDGVISIIHYIWDRSKSKGFRTLGLSRGVLLIELLTSETSGARRWYSAEQLTPGGQPIWRTCLKLDKQERKMPYPPKVIPIACGMGLEEK